MKNFVCLATAISVASPSFASAQTGNDIVVVTAQRREQSAQDVGIALNAFDAVTLIDGGVRDVNALENLAPSLEIESQFGGGQPSFSIRGVGFRDYASLNSPTVGVYVDDVAYPIPVMTQGVLFDVDRVEVLRGPQGTLYGRNTTGGAIKIITARPTDEAHAGLIIEAGRFGRVDAEGFASGSISDTVRVRLSGATSLGGDWQINRETGEEIGAAEQYALRGIAEIDLGENLLATINLHGFIDQSDGLGLQLFNDSVFGPERHRGRRSTSFGSSAEFASLIGIDQDQHPFRDTESWGANFNIDGAIGDIALKYIGAFETLNRKEFNDWDALSIGAAGVYFESSATVMSHELRATGDVGDRMRVVSGIYYSEEDLNELYQSDFVESFGDGFAVSTPYNQNVRTIAAYAHGEFNLTDSVTLIGGVRYEDEKRELENLGTFATGFGPLNFANGTIDGTLEDRRLDADNLSGKASIEYRPFEQLLTYASYSHGVKSGGFTAYNTLNPNALDPFLPEKLDAYEVGFKSDNFNDAVRLNGAAFFYDYKDQQVQSAIFDPGTSAIVGRIVNAPKSQIWGGELELLWKLSGAITFGQTIAFKKGEFKLFTDLDTAATSVAGSAVFVDRSGQRLGFPEVSYQGFVESEHALASGWKIRTRLDYSYRDDLALPLLGEAYRVDDYWLTNAFVELSPEGGAWSIAFWGRNILNADYDETRNFFIAPGGVADIAAPGLPATYGARLSLRY